MSDVSAQQEQLNTEAIRMSTEAVTMIRGHLEHHTRLDEEARDERKSLRTDFMGAISGMNDSLRRVHERIDALTNRWFWAATVMVGGLASSLGYVLYYGPPWGP